MGHFRTYVPIGILRPYVKELAFAENSVAQTYKVLPGTSLVIGVQYSGQLYQVIDAQNNSLDAAGITGLLDSYRVFHNSVDIGTVLIYFTEQGASAFFRLPMDELFGQSVSLQNFFPTSALALLRERLAEAQDDIGRIAVMETFLVSHLRFPQTDPLVDAAVRHIRQSLGMVRIKELAAMLHVSQSALERRFRSVVGASPKKYATIIRFDHTLKALPQTNRLTDLALDAGYYDQAHFIKAFKQFAGDTPEQFFKQP